MKRIVQYLATVALLVALIALMACGQEEPPPAAPPAAEPTTDMMAPTDAMPGATDAMQEATAAPGAAAGSESTAMSNQGESRLSLVQSRGAVACANNTQLAGFGFLEADGSTRGFDIELCRAVAAAVLGDADALEFHPTTAAERGPTMQSGTVDMMSRNTTWTSSRDATWGNFAQTMFYDGQGFMVPTSLNVGSAIDLADSKVCVQKGTTTELNLQDFSNQHDLHMDIVTFEDAATTSEAYLTGQCDALTTDRSGLVATRVGFEHPEEHVILPDTISEEPLGAVVPHGDDQWYDIVKSVMAIMIYAEEFDITSTNVPTAATGDTAVDRLFGLEGAWGQEELGLKMTVAQDVIGMVGNYGEIYDRHLTPLGLTREGSRNDLWTNGGEIYAAPLR